MDVRITDLGFAYPGGARVLSRLDLEVTSGTVHAVVGPNGCGKSTLLRIVAGLQGHTTGYAVPTFVVDGPGGGGKIPLFPETVVGREGDFLLLRNYAGEVSAYPDPLPRRDR